MGKNKATTPPEGEHITEQLSAYMDNALDAAAHEAVRLHLAVCAPCLAEHDELLATRDLVRSVSMVAPPRAFTLTQEMVAPSRKAGFWEQLLAPRNAPRLATGSAMAFALVLMLFVGQSFNTMVASPSVMQSSAERESLAAGNSYQESSPGVTGVTDTSAQEDKLAMAPLPTQSNPLEMTDASLPAQTAPAAGASADASATTGAVARSFASPEANPKAQPPPFIVTGTPEAQATTLALAYSATAMAESNHQDGETTLAAGDGLMRQAPEGPSYAEQRPAPAAGGIDALTIALVSLAALGLALAAGALVARGRVS